MPPTLSELLEVAKIHDAKIHGRNVKINKAIQDAGQIDVTPGIPVKEISLQEEEGDPFNGNLNNRRVAARIARQPHSRRSANTHDPFNIGDPKKAADDVKKSLTVNPEPLLLPDEDVLARPMLLPPTPGSPAAQRKAQEKSKGASMSPAAPAATPEAPAASTDAPPTWGSGG